MFVGRQQELQQLNRAYDSGNFGLVVVSGRRHIGKTTLLREFTKDKSAIYLTARELTDKYNLHAFERALAEYSGEKNVNIGNWRDGFAYLRKKTENQRIIVVFENYTDACLTNKELSSLIAEQIENWMLDSRIMLVVSGNHMTSLEREILGENSSVSKYVTLHIRLGCLSEEEAHSFMGGFAALDQKKLYRCVGGTPLYLSMIDQNKTADANIEDLFFSRSGFLYNDIGMSLQKELIGPAVYNSLLRAIAHGKTKAREILDETGEESGKAHKYLNVLLSMGIICRDIPEGADPNTSRKGTWRFADNAVHFWYRYVLDNIEKIDKGLGSTLLAQIEE